MSEASEAIREWMDCGEPTTAEGEPIRCDAVQRIIDERDRWRARALAHEERCRPAARALARIADALGVTGSPEEIAARVESMRAERDILGAAHDRALDALGGGGQSSTLSEAVTMVLAELARLRATVEAADALREAAMRYVQAGVPGSSWLHDAVEAYDDARGEP